jgi:hypothetical protein
MYVGLQLKALYLNCSGHREFYVAQCDQNGRIFAVGAIVYNGIKEINSVTQIMHPPQEQKTRVRIPPGFKVLKENI